MLKKLAAAVKMGPEDFKKRFALAVA